MENKKAEFLAKLDEYIYCLNNCDAVCGEYIDLFDNLTREEQEDMSKDPEYRRRANILVNISNSIKNKYRE